MSNRTKISLPHLQNIIVEEIKSFVSEQVDHQSIRDVVNGASKLLAAVEDFEENASQSMTNAVTPHLAEIKKVLENMVSIPGSYVEKKNTLKKVSLKPSKPGKNKLV